MSKFRLILHLKKAVEIAQAGNSELAAKESQEVEKKETSEMDVRELAENATDLMADGSFEKAAREFEKLTRLAPEQGGRGSITDTVFTPVVNWTRRSRYIKRRRSSTQFAGIATYNLACAYSLKKPG